MTRREREQAAYELVKRIAAGKFWVVDAPLQEKAKAVVRGSKGSVDDG
jgi:hypothetical protein